ncbi:MAG: hypothetical protein KAJ03_05125 [Gammaproteobacteria bacterium]|nr:hypothetical protein [Gammaproteobacteria bacterium]
MKTCCDRTKEDADDTESWFTDEMIQICLAVFMVSFFIGIGMIGLDYMISLGL